MTAAALLDPPILFFCLGLISVATKSNLEIPPALSKFLSLYLLLAIGFKGGVSLSDAGLHPEILKVVFLAILMSTLIPILVFLALKKRLGALNAAAVSAAYGSVSAVTFITAASWLELRQIEFGGFMVAALALMESPAIIIAVFLARYFGSKKGTPLNIRHILYDAIFNSSVFLLMGSLIVGLIVGKQGAQGLHTFIYDIFKGFLCIFLLDLGVMAGEQLRKVERKEAFILAAFALVTPFISASLAFAFARTLDIAPGNTFLMMAMAASASYIAAPAAIRQALPEANSSYYLATALGITFPINIIIGLPIYWYIVNLFG